MLKWLEFVDSICLMTCENLGVVFLIYIFAAATLSIINAMNDWCRHLEKLIFSSFTFSKDIKLVTCGWLCFKFRRKCFDESIKFYNTNIGCLVHWTWLGRFYSEHQYLWKKKGWPMPCRPLCVYSGWMICPIFQ